MVKKGKSPKYKNIVEIIENEILDGRYIAGNKIPTQEELSGRFGVSRPTVEKALECLELKGLLERRRGAGTFVIHNYRSQQRRKRFGLIALRPPRDVDFGSNFVQSIISDFSVVAKNKNFELLVDATTVSNERELFEHSFSSCKDFLDSKIDGLFMLPVDFVGENTTINEAITSAFRSADVPVVLLDRDIVLSPRRSRFDVVGVNNRRAGFVITNHMIAMGTDDLYFVTCNLKSNTICDRRDGFKCALEYNNIDATGRVVYSYDYNNKSSGCFLIMDILKKSKGACGFVCVNDETASILMRDIVRLGYDVPSRVRLCGFDDLPTSPLLFSPLTTIAQPVAAIVQTAINVMNNRLNDTNMPPRDVYVAEKLVVRESCGFNNCRG